MTYQLGSMAGVSILPQQAEYSHIQKYENIMKPKKARPKKNYLFVFFSFIL